jgi:heavy metal sensor kinase
MPRSLRWRLLLWSGLLLVFVVVLYGSALYAEVRHARFAEIDSDLEQGLRLLEGSLRTFPKRLLESGPPPERGAHPADRPWDGPGPGGPGPPGRPGPGGPGGGPGREGPPPGPVRPADLMRALALPEERRHAEGARTGPPLFFVVWTTRGDVLKASPLPPGYPVAADLYSALPRPRTATVLQRDEFRELVLLGPESTLILVGRDIRGELADLGRLAWQLVLAGLGAIALGLVGVWWVARQAVRPIEAMSQTAGSITASNLSGRIDTAEAASELGQLGLILNAMFDRLEIAFDQQVRFTADASHELRTPLAVLLSHLELALTRPRPAEEYRQTLLTCQRAAKRMQELVRDLLTLARADAGKLELATERVDLALLVEENIGLLEPLARQWEVTLHWEGESIEVRGDPERLAQVASNLLTNAILYNRPGGQVYATLRKVEGAQGVAGDPRPMVELRVRDTGMGIASEHLPHIFERFYRVDTARSRDSGGSGLGLAICQSILAAHNGTIAVESEVGVGTTFIVRLPIS